MTHLDIKIYGKVQGVGFRHSAKVKAAGLGVVGFVRNEPGGEVYLEIEGEAGIVEEFLEWCREFGGVEKVESEEGTVKNFKDFVIK